MRRMINLSLFLLPIPFPFSQPTPQLSTTSSKAALNLKSIEIPPAPDRSWKIRRNPLPAKVTLIPRASTYLVKPKSCRSILHLRRFRLQNRQLFFKFVEDLKGSFVGFDVASESCQFVHLRGVIKM